MRGGDSLGLNFQDRAELRRREREKEELKKKRQKEIEEEERRRKKLQSMLDRYNFGDDQGSNEEEEQQEDEQEDDRRDNKDRKDKDKDDSNQEDKNKDEGSQKDSKQERNNSNEGQDGTKSNDLKNEGPKSDNLKEPGSGTQPNPNASGPTGSTGPSGSPGPSGPSGSPGPAGAPASGAGSAGSAGSAASGAGGGAAAAGGATAGAPVLLIILIVILALILICAIGYLISSSTFSQKENMVVGDDTMTFDLEETTVARIIQAREEEFDKPLLRFSTEDTKFLFFFTISESEYKRLIYSNLSDGYDDIIKALKKQLKEEVNVNSGKKSPDSLLYKRNDNGKLEARFTVDNADDIMRQWGVSGFSIKNYLLYLENDEFTNSFLADTLSSRTIEEVYDTLINSEQEEDRGNVQLESITEEFRDYIMYKSKGFILKNFDYNKVESSDLKYLKDEYYEQYEDFLKTDLTFALIYKYLFCTTDNFNSILWTVYKGHHEDGTVEVVKDMDIDRYGKKDSKDQRESVFVPKVVAMDLNTNKIDDTTYENNMKTITAMVNPYLMHWVVPYAVNVATSDYNFSLDVMYNMACPVRMDLFEVETKTVNITSYLYMNIDYKLYTVLYRCNLCNSKVSYMGTYTHSHRNQEPSFTMLTNESDYSGSNPSYHNPSMEVSTRNYMPGGTHTQYPTGYTIAFYNQVGDYIQEVNNVGEMDYKLDQISKVEDKNLKLVPKIRYAEGMFKIKKEEWALKPYVDGKPKERTDSIDANGILTRTELYQDEFGREEGGEFYEKTYKLSYLEEKDYNEDGARKSGDKINRIEWFLDYGSGENEMFPDKTSDDWYLNYNQFGSDKVAEGEIDWDTFRNFYHVSYNEVSRVAEKNNFEVIPDEDSTENFCKYIEYKYVKNIDALRKKMKELEESDEKDTEQLILKQIYEKKSEYGFTFEFDVLTEENYKKEQFKDFIDKASSLFVNAWNKFIGRQTPIPTGFYSDNPLIDACFKVNTIQGYSYDNLDFALVEIEKYYDELPTYTSDMLGDSVESMMISTLPPGGLGWPVKDVNGTESSIIGDYKSGKHNGIDIDAGYQEGKNYGSPALAVFDGTVVGVCQKNESSNISGKIMIQSTNGCYIAIYEGMYSINVSLGSKVSKGQELGLIGKPLSDVNKNCTSKVPVYLHFRVAYDVTGSFSEVAGDSVAEKLWFTLIRAGLSEYAAAGVLGNIQNESGFKLGAVEQATGIGIGLCQWSFTRRTGLENYAKSLGKSWADESVQFNFLLTELGLSNAASSYASYALISYKGYSPSQWVNSQSPEDAAAAFCWTFERPAGDGHISRRRTDARNYYNMFSGKTQSTQNTSNTSNMIKPDGTYDIPESMFVDPSIFFNITDGKYSGTSVTSEGGSYSSHKSKVTGKGFSLYSQTGAYYSNWAWSWGSGNIAAIGCPLTATTNALAAVGVTTDPGKLFELSNRSGSNPATLRLDKLGASYSGPSGPMASSTIKTTLTSGSSIVFRSASWTSSGHWMALVDYDESTNTVYLATGKCNGHAGISNLQGNSGDGWYAVSDIASIMTDSVYVISK